MNHRSAKDATPLIAATIGGHEPVVRMLLKAGADVTARTGIPGTSTDGIPGTLEVHSLQLAQFLGRAKKTYNRKTAMPLALAYGPHDPNPAIATLFKPSSHRPPPARPPTPRV